MQLMLEDKGSSALHVKCKEATVLCITAPPMPCSASVIVSADLLDESSDAVRVRDDAGDVALHALVGRRASRHHFVEEPGVAVVGLDAPLHLLELVHQVVDSS